MSSARSTASWQGTDSGSLLTRTGRAILGSAPIFVVLAIVLVWIRIENPNFTDPPVFLLFLKRAAPLMILAAGQAFVIVSGEYDLSVGATITATVIMAAAMIDGEASRSWPVIALLLIAGLVVGLVNGIVTTKVGVPSFVTTLGTMLIVGGAVNWWVGGTPRGALTPRLPQMGTARFR